MKVVVFGAAGWVGRAILDNLTGRHEVRACDRGPEAWAKGNELQGEWVRGEIVHSDITDFDAVDEALEGVDAVIHAAVHSGPSGDKIADDGPYLVNLKGLWNVLEATHRRGIERVVHIGSCQVVHPEGIFFGPEVRRPDCSLYAVTKRLQEEMCRQFHDAFSQSIVVLRPCSIMDSRLGLAKRGAKLGPGSWSESWVCRHDLAEACRLGIETEGLGLEILHMAGTTEAEAHCNVARAREVLGLEFRADLDQYR
jgi:nucleoside-diphosphate-sugar epimerase